MVMSHTEERLRKMAYVIGEESSMVLISLL